MVSTPACRPATHSSQIADAYRSLWKEVKSRMDGVPA
jgi:hypothetical protein